MGPTLLLTGRPGIGKTTIIKAVAQVLGDQAGGFYTEEIRGPGGRKGFRLITLDGEETILAHVQLKGGGRPRVGRYGVDVAALDRVGVAAIERALADREVIIVDEIGKMELFSGNFKEAVMRAVLSPRPLVATIMAKKNAWADALKMMPGITLWEVTQQKRDALHDQVLPWLRERFG
ncbi:MAG: NTPase, partial [Chloroflexi bacterium]